MADHKVSNERKKELEQLDPFQENLLKAMAYVKEYKKQLILIVGAVVLVAVVFSGIMYSFQKSENTAAILVSQALTKYAQANDPDKGYLAIEKDFQAIFTDYANTTAGRQAKMKFAKICYDASKFDQSYKYYKESLELFKNQALMENFVLASLGHVCLARNEVEEAKRYFLQIDKGQTDLLKDEALFALAMLYEAADNTSESKKMYEKIVVEHGSSMYGPIAKSKIAEIK
ncbi:MAG: tetratricopeptide repeat protein [Proteobacteria bacterium]|nr:tetratricopeptide repeat protein [Pseudomonadota bacterium]MBU1582790.1 tetratricopeptide repeat protein [Pseudomonadota bacterium]MBU2454369.1 tetratricopeptide repeat protein [Pseudomonadota bacterium]MBU2631501.1 tetratricopeptide repeat protein [Pseudomonadota bacterium]